MEGALAAGAGAGSAGLLGSGLAALAPEAVAAGLYPGGLTASAIHTGLLANTPQPAIAGLGGSGGGLAAAAPYAGLIGGGLLAADGIAQGREGQAALGGALAGYGGASLAGYSGLAAAGPWGLAAAALAAIGSSMVNTREFGDVALRNYWSGVDSGRNIGESDPTELAQGFINFYRTNKNEFAPQAVYGRTGNEDFLFDMTQKINSAVSGGQVAQDATPQQVYAQVVQPWMQTMGAGPQNEDARRVQDFMMTDLINSYMTGKPISNAQVKNDSKFRIVSERPVYSGTYGRPAQPTMAAPEAVMAPEFMFTPQTQFQGLMGY
jgi:hypothetical protein